MATGPEHYTEGERLSQAAQFEAENGSTVKAAIYATLALAEFTAAGAAATAQHLMSPEYIYIPAAAGDTEAWSDVIHPRGEQL